MLYEVILLLFDVKLFLKPYGLLLMMFVIDVLFCLRLFLVFELLLYKSRSLSVFVEIWLRELFGIALLFGIFGIALLFWIYV